MMFFLDWQEKQNVLELEKCFFLFQNRKNAFFPFQNKKNAFFPFQNGKNACFPVLEQEKCLFSCSRTGKMLFFLFQSGKNAFFRKKYLLRKKQEKYKKTLCFVYCSNSVLLEPFFIVFNCIFPRFSWFKIDSRNLFRFSACSLKAEKCFSNQF